MATFTGTAGADNFGGAADEADVFRFTSTTLSGADTVVGGGGAVVDLLRFTAAGAFTAAAFAGVSGVEAIVLANGANALTLDEDMVASATGESLRVTGGTGNDSVDASGLTGVNRVIVIAGAGDDVLTGGAGRDTFRFEAADFASDTVTGNGGADTLEFTTAGTVTAAAFSATSGIEAILLADAGNAVTLSNALLNSAADRSLTVTGGTGNDSVNGSALVAANRITVTSGAGSDTLRGGAGADVFRFQAADFGSDTVAGNGGVDTLQFTTAGTVAAAAFTGMAEDSVAGNGRTDTVQFTTAGAVADTAFSATRGIESVTLANGGNAVTLLDAMVASANGDKVTVTGRAGNDNVDASGLTGANRMIALAGAGDDTLVGGAGNDIFRFVAANMIETDVVTGGAGVDTLQFLTAGILIGPDFTNVTGIETIVLADPLGGINNFLQLDDDMVSTAINRTVTVIGTDGDDEVEAGPLSAPDRVVVIAGAGADELLGGFGADTFSFDQSNFGDDTVSGRNGIDTLLFTTGGALSAADFADVSGIETIELADADNNITLTDAMVGLAIGQRIDVNGGAGADTVDGSAVVTAGRRLDLDGADGSDVLTGGAGGNALTGGAGADQLRGISGGDILNGGLGGDTFRYLAAPEFGGGEFIDGTAETATDDVIRVDSGGAYNFGLGTVINIDVVAVGQSVANLQVTLSNGMVASADGNNDGVAGDLNIVALVALSNGIVADASTVSNGAVTVAGANLGGADTVTGGAGNDFIDGGVGADSIVGGGGNDTIVGRTGGDSLNGGAGDDDFVYVATADSNETKIPDLISGFGSTDQLNFSRLALSTDTSAIFNRDSGAYLGSTANFFVDVGTGFAVAIQTNGTTTRVYADSNGDEDYTIGQDLMVEFTGDVTTDLKSTDDYIFT